ncbi:hypothetical protein [Shewanella litorisediminis]|uniref:Uncharacterized protein n=1 Tax=Shewanella litorisediminis TaxID=1173586 RepID=A0ABX7FYP8_9GAMM|nr:hypothetical protein [Shewanella litorisediminis]MCL2919240.1 hypothetical protein [Shewanella litorisediminis]QRH00165.1 hypothetical protein JQC75_09585 [Shewanella litorisediminis]
MISTQCGELTEIAMMAVCGAPTTDINILGIASSDMDKALSLGFTAISSLKSADSAGYVTKACN